MADLGTIAFGTFTAVADTAITGTEPVLQVIASADAATNVHDTANTTHVGTSQFALGDMPADFGTMVTLSVQVRYALSTTASNNTWDFIQARVIDSGGGPLTNQIIVVTGPITTTTPTDSLAIPFTGVNLTETKSTWDAANIHLFFYITRVKGGDAVEERIFAAELTGTYLPAVATPTKARREFIPKLHTRRFYMVP